MKKMYHRYFFKSSIFIISNRVLVTAFSFSLALDNPLQVALPETSVTTSKDNIVIMYERYRVIDYRLQVLLQASSPFPPRSISWLASCGGIGSSTTVGTRNTPQNNI